MFGKNGSREPRTHGFFWLSMYKSSQEKRRSRPPALVRTIRFHNFIMELPSLRAVFAKPRVRKEVELPGYITWRCGKVLCRVKSITAVQTWWCGYVEIPSHVNINEDAMGAFEVYGGITYVGMLDDGCLYIGFDTTHNFPLRPECNSLEFVKKETERLAKQVQKLL